MRKQEQIAALKARPQITGLQDDLEFVVVPDMAKSGAFDGVFDGVSAVLHLASPLAVEVRLKMRLFFEAQLTRDYRLATTTET